MNKNLAYLLGLLAVAGIVYLISKGLFSIVLGYTFLAIGVAAPLMLSYFIYRNLYFPHWVILLWVGFMVGSVGVIAEPTLLHPVGYLVCPDGFETPEVAVKTTQLYDGATNTSAKLSCRGATGAVDIDSPTDSFVAAALYLLVCLPLLLIAAIVSKFRGREWGPTKCFSAAIVLYGLLAVGVRFLPELPALLRSAVQSFLG